MLGIYKVDCSVFFFGEFCLHIDVPTGAQPLRSQLVCLCTNITMFVFGNIFLKVSKV